MLLSKSNHFKTKQYYLQLLANKTFQRLNHLVAIQVNIKTKKNTFYYMKKVNKNIFSIKILHMNTFQAIIVNLIIGHQVTKIIEHNNSNKRK